jgi:hypothetical protein
LIADGERLKQRSLESFNTFEELKECKNNVDKWIEAIAHQLYMVYRDKSLKDDFARPIDDVDIENDWRQEAIEKLKANIDGRIQGLHALTRDTLSNEGRV